MNWIPQLVTGGDDKIVALVPEALEARGLCRQKQYGRALGILWQMLRLARRSDSKEREAFVLIHIGKVYRNWIWDIALKFFRDGLAAAQGCGFKRGEMIANNAIGELYYAWGKQDEALKYYTRSLHAAHELGDPSCQREILLDMVDCYEEQGEFERCDELVREALRLDEELDGRALGDVAMTAEYAEGSRARTAVG
jgi:tetratricopeptide (TPR) repeat protein